MLAEATGIKNKSNCDIRAVEKSCESRLRINELTKLTG